MQLHDVHRDINKRKKRKRIGRGIGSGHGKTSSKGHKGHSSRQGFKQNPLTEGGQMPLARRVPKRGFFNGAFERKEYMEAYVAEQVAADMLKDPAVAAEFQKRLAEDPEFARSPQARLDFFYRRHPSFDERLNLYPIYRTDVMP